MKLLTDYTIDDINYVITHEPDRELLAFKKNIVIELRENYKLMFSEIGDLLNENYKTLKSIYYKNK